MRDIRFLGQAPEHLSGLGSHGQHRLHKKTTSANAPDWSHAADRVPMGQIDVGGILHQQHHWGGIGLVPALLQVRLHQREPWSHLAHPANDTTL
jgi:hypothetical protein